MKRLTKLPELLAPAGSREALWAAVAAGADAVYLGGKSFGARAYAQNFDETELAEAIRYCHLRGVKLYVTVNTLIFDREMRDALAFCAKLYQMGADAVISADVGLISLLRQYLPGLPVHLSTQAGIHNAAGVTAAAELGATRAVFAREASLADIRAAVENSPLEIEVFLHGALCVCHSGQCLFSSLVGGRSGNRGECAQPCRLPYNGSQNFPLSLRDLSLAPHVCALSDTGVASLKIEGRMKSPDYVFGVTSVYRRLLDEGKDGTAADEKTLAGLFSRGGFTDGYFIGNPAGAMTGVRSEEDKAQTRAASVGTYEPLRTPVRASATFRAGKPATLSLTDGIKTVTVTGDVPQPAQNAPLDASELTARLCKMGNTPLSLTSDDVSLTLEDGLFLPAGAVNALRRAAAEAFCRTEREAVTLPALPKTARQNPAPWRSAVFFRADVLRQAPDCADGFDRVFVPLADFTPRGAANGVALPPVLMHGEWEAARPMVEAAAKAGARYALVGNLSHLSLIAGTGLIPVGDFRLNITNADSAAYYRARGVAEQILSPELSLPMLRDIGGGAIVYGRIPLMITERCFVRENGGCGQCGSFSLTDRMGKSFPILREYPHRNLICNAVVTYMGDRKDDLRACRVAGEHFLFTVETATEIRRVKAAYEAGEPMPFAVRRIQK